MALGRRLPGLGRVDVGRGVRGRDAFQGPEFVQSAHGHHGPGHRAQAQGRAAVGAVGERLGEGRHMVPGDLARVLAAGCARNLA